jgi:non-canonical (house-cleaning) NTP pyrophosphatase
MAAMSAHRKVNGMYKTPEKVREAVQKAIRFGEAFPLTPAQPLIAQNVGAVEALSGGWINRIDVHRFMARKEIQTHRSSTLERSPSLHGKAPGGVLVD